MDLDPTLTVPGCPHPHAVAWLRDGDDLWGGLPRISPVREARAPHTPAHHAALVARQSRGGAAAFVLRAEGVADAAVLLGGGGGASAAGAYLFAYNIWRTLNAWPPRGWHHQGDLGRSRWSRGDVRCA